MPRVLLFPIFVAFTLVMTTLPGCSPSDPDTASATQTTQAANDQPARPRNCLLILLDAFAAGHSSHLGYERTTSPNIDALAKQGVSFTNAYAQCPNTVGSVVSFMTGQYLPQPHADGIPYSLGPDRMTLAELFERSGFATAGYSENPYIHPSNGFDRGFAAFEARSALAPRDPKRKFRARDESAGPALLSGAERWIGQQTTPWMCYVHLLRPHDPYAAPAPFGDRFRTEGAAPARPDHDLQIMWKRRWRDYTPTTDELQYVIDAYDGGLAYVDALVGGFLERLRDAGQLDDTLVVVFSDHGEAFLQHGEFKHNTTVYEEMIHVPLIFVPPDGTDWHVGTRDAVVELVDLFPTLGEVFQLKEVPSTNGESLTPLLYENVNTTTGSVYAQNVTADRIAYRAGSDKLVFWKKDDDFVPAEWYNLDSDHLESRNLMADRAPTTELLEAATLALQRHYVPPTGAARKADAEQAELLKALGYTE